MYYFFKVVAINQYGGGQYDREGYKYSKLDCGIEVGTFEMNRTSEKIILDASLKQRTLSVRGK